MDFCPSCGAAVFATEIAEVLDDDDMERLNILDSGDVSFVPMFLQSAACRQLREICYAAQQDMLDMDTFGNLLVELEVYVEREVVRFQLMPELDHPGYSSGCVLIQEGLQLMRDAIQVAAEWPIQGKSMLSLALRIASDADIQVGQGRQMLERAAA